AYGNKGSGKTYTMEGAPDNRGVIYRTIEELFRMIEERKDNFVYCLKLSAVAIQNEIVIDRLNDDVATTYTSSTTVLPQIEVSNNVTKLECTHAEKQSQVIISVQVTGKNRIVDLCSIGKLHFVDLGESSHFFSKGDQTQSLSILDNILIAITQQGTDVPYCNNALASLLQDSIGNIFNNLFFYIINHYIVFISL
ncbi:hypothetical protein RFI_27866, partial [Reticulomyxa filosa]